MGFECELVLLNLCQFFGFGYGYVRFDHRGKVGEDNTIMLFIIFAIYYVKLFKIKKH